MENTKKSILDKEQMKKIVFEKMQSDEFKQQVLQKIKERIKTKIQEKYGNGNGDKE